MDTKRARLWRAGAFLLGALCLFGAGCGLGGRADRAETAPGPEAASSASLRAVARVGDFYDIFSVVPSEGPLAGGNPVELRGLFPDAQTPELLEAALETFAVYFGDNVASYDFTLDPVMSSGSIYVTVPPGNVPGFVDVKLRNEFTQEDAATLFDGYQYLDPYAITGVVPGAGPLEGGQQVTVTGRFPISELILTVAEAEAAYGVYFDGFPATFDDTAEPIISPDAMHVITPPGTAPGFVNVSVATTVLPSESPLFRVLRRGYEYILSEFDIYSVDPDRGKICGLEPVTLHGAFPVSTAFSQSLIGNLAGASQFYSVYFNDQLAVFDPSVPTPVITATEMFVLSPPGDDVGLADVRIVSHDGDNFSDAVFRQLNQAYRYYAMTLTRCLPPQGPIAGGNVVGLEGFLPGLAAIDNVADAAAAYTVYFGGVKATFADMTPDPVFLPSVILDIASCSFTPGFMFVIAPPGATPGFVNVTIEDNTGKDLPTTALNSYEYIGGFQLDAVDPDRGRICGGEAVTLRGQFPVTQAFSDSLLGNIAVASQFYSVYFKDRLADFDPAFPTSVITQTEMHVIAPPGEDVGLVDVRIVSHDPADISNSAVAQLDQAYHYFAMTLVRCDPPVGPLGGGTLVRLEGFLPGLAAIDNVADAEAAYTVTFGGIKADFADMTPDPIFLPAQLIDAAACVYQPGYMYVIAPPGATPGLVDVEIVDDTGKDLPTTLVDGYLYTGSGGGVSAWSVAEVCPNPIGKLEAGQLLVRIEGTGEMDSRATVENPVFIVPQGGIPSNTGDRILLTELTYAPSGPGFVWTGTNATAIPRIMNVGQPNELLVDGHAALYIDIGGGEILGDDPNNPTDGGIIQTSAQQGRHFLIDTIPPRLMGNALRGDNFVAPLFASGAWTTQPGVVDMGTFPFGQVTPHPYDYSGVSGTANGLYDAPFDGRLMTRPSDPDSMAQVFFNVSSLTNNFAGSAPDAAGVPTANLQFTLNVFFEDVDIYTMLNLAPGSRDADFFGGSTVRQVAGFANGLNTSVSGLSRDEALVNGSATLQDLLIWWDFQPTPFLLPEITGITVQYVTDPNGPMAIGARPDLSPTNLAATPTQLQGTFMIGDPSDATTGVWLAEAGQRTLLSVVFRAVDRAGDNFQLCSGTVPRGKLFTRDDTSITEFYAPDQQPEMGPLNLWWLRTTATRLTSTIPPSGDIRAPAFSWQNTGVPDPAAIIDPFDQGVERRYSYGIYRYDTALGGQRTRDEQRDGPYSLIGSWSGWTNLSSLTPNEVQQIIASDGGATEGVWFLLVVMSADEAGNIELWPETQLQTPSGLGPQTIGSIFESGVEERNWARWFVPPSGEAVDTRVEPFFWHDGGSVPTPFAGDRIDGFNEPTFGDAEVIPLPSPARFSPSSGVLLERVSARFRITLIADSLNINVQWELVRNGESLYTVVGGSEIGEDPSDGTVGVVLPLALDVDASNTLAYLGSAFRQPTYYTLRARTFIDANVNGALDSGEIYDASPATVQFVVVDNVAHFIQNRKAEDTQPIQEMDRP
jgi:hypothetical protein